MKYLLNAKAVVAVAVVAIIVPLVLRVVSFISSPIIFLLFLPLIVLLLACFFVAVTIFLGYLADKNAVSKANVRCTSRPFTFSTPAAWQAVITRSQWSQNTPQSFPPLCPNVPLLSVALNDILIMIVRDFVLTWYKDLSSSPSFPLAVSALFHEATKKLIERAAGLDLPDLAVKRIIPMITSHIEQFRQSEIALRGAGLERQLTQSDELDLLLASRYSSKSTGRLHPAIDNLSTTFTKQTEETHLRHLVERALPYILPEHESRSETIKIVLREIIVCTVLQPVMDMLADPDFWNRSIDQVAGAVIHQQKLVTKVRNVLAAQSPRKQQPTHNSISPSTELITIHTNIPQFESFLRGISRCSSLLDARRLKNDIVNEIRRTRMLLANHEKEDWINGQKTEDVVAFLDRLYTARRKVEERIVVLGGQGEHTEKQSNYHEHERSRLTLRDILRNPSSLSYFMEFMDRRRRSLLVQFWLTVESFKNPLESVDSGTSEDEDDKTQDISVSSGTIKEDIAMINDLYFSRPVPPTLSSISKKHIDLIHSFANSDTSPSTAEQRKVRRAVMLAQRQVEQVMEQDFEEFERSELWFRAIGDTVFGTRSAATSFVGQRTESPPPISPTARASNIRERHPIGGRGAQMRRSTSASSRRSSKSSATTPPHRPQTTNIEVLMSPVSDSSPGLSRPPLFDDDPEDLQQREDERRMRAIKAALTDIMASEEQDQTPASPRKDGLSKTTISLTGAKERPVFDDVLDDDSADNDPDTDEGNHDDTSNGRKSFQLAGPGDLQLSYEIVRLGEKITSLDAQSLMLDTLIKKAELTGDMRELRLLVKSKSSMTRDLRELKFQKLQYEQQESANRLLSDRTNVSILSSTVADEDGKSVVRYLVEIQQVASDGTHASGWVVARRYNEFFNLHNKLRERYALVKNLDFPGKRLVTSLSGSFLDSRRIGLEKYLQNLIAIPIVCESDELRAFLSRDSPFVASNPHADSEPSPFLGTDLVRNVYRSFTESIDDMFFGPSMLDVMIQRLTRQAAEFAGIVGNAVNDEDLVAQALNMGKSSPEATLLQLAGDLKPIEGETTTSTFSAPICDLVLAVFELDRKNNWLRRQAIVVILQEVLGGTIERKIRETFKTLVAEPNLLYLVKNFRDALWPGGKLRSTHTPRTMEEKSRTRDEANKKLSSLLPDLAANMIGRSNARRGARRMFAVLQNRRLNQHIAYTIVDEIFMALFSEPTTSASTRPT